jgi:hypothetical protein
VGTGRVHPRRTAGRTGTGTAGRRVRRVRVDEFFVSKPYPIRLILVPVVGTQVPRVRLRRYSGTDKGTSTGFFLLFFKSNLK